MQIHRNLVMTRHLVRAALYSHLANHIASEQWVKLRGGVAKNINVERLGQIMRPHTTLDVGPALEKKWSLQGYFYREYFISLGRTDGKSAYRLEWAAEHEPPAGYSTADLELKLLRLYKRADIADLRASDSSAQ